MEHIPLQTLDESKDAQDNNKDVQYHNFLDFLLHQGRVFSGSILLLLALCVPIIIGVLPTLSAVSFKTCMDGNFRVSDISSPFDPRTVFAISLGFGSFDFAVAKGIDVAFDLIVGRGGQLALGLIAYPVFTDVLLYSMESRPASYNYFAAIAFDTVSVSTMAQISKDLGRQPKGHRSLRTILISVGLLLASLHILAFPTLASAATGYITSQDPVVPLVEANGTTEPWPGGFQICAFVIEDGNRVVGLSASQCILNNNSLLFNQTSNYNELVKNETFSTDGNSLFGEQELDKPPLKVHERAGYDLRGTYYSTEYLEDHGFCKPNDNKYKWGFSYLLLFVMIILTYVWVGILAAMYAEIRRKGYLARHGRRLGLYRAVLDFSKAIRDELGEDAQLFPNSRLERLLGDAKEGIRYKVPA